MSNSHPYSEVWRNHMKSDGQPEGVGQTVGGLCLPTGPLFLWILVFLDSTSSEIRQYLSFSVWLISLDRGSHRNCGHLWSEEDSGREGGRVSELELVGWVRTGQNAGERKAWGSFWKCVPFASFLNFLSPPLTPPPTQNKDPISSFFFLQNTTQNRFNLWGLFREGNLWRQVVSEVVREIYIIKSPFGMWYNLNLRLLATWVLPVVDIN